MKSLHIFHHHGLLNGVDRSTLTLVRALLAAGHTPHALVPAAGNVSTALTHAGIPHRIAPLACCAGDAAMAELRFLSDCAERAATIYNWLQQEAFDLVHLNTGHLLDGAIAATRAGVPALWHLHAPFDIDYQRYARHMSRQGYAWLLGQLGTGVLAVSHDVRNSVLPHLPPDRVHLLYNGIDIDDLDQRALETVGANLRESLQLPPAAKLVLGVGRICQQKDFAAFVRVAAILAAQRPDVCFAIAGPAEDPALAHALEQLIIDLNLTRRVFLLGPRNDVPALLAQADALLSTAIFEGQGLAALEAMALRRPVVAMACVGLRECITHQKDGLLVPPGDELTCARALLDLLDEPTRGHYLGKAARETVRQKFSSAHFVSTFIELAGRSKPPTTNQRAAADFALGLLSSTRETRKELEHTENPAPRLMWRLRQGVKRMIRSAATGARP